MPSPTPANDHDTALLAGHGLTLDDHTPETWTALAADVLRGMTADEKHLPAKWFYDARGSDLFDEICEQPEYYLTRAETDLLERRGDELAAAFPAQELLELGSGSSTKTPLLLEPLQRAGKLERYVGVDVSASALLSAQAMLRERFPALELEYRVLDFTTQLAHLGIRRDGGRLVALLGSTLGNLEPTDVQAFLTALRSQLGAHDRLLLGLDLVKDEATLHAAYNDNAGVTAAFNRNVLEVVNRELGANFDPEAFAHDARWNPGLERIETRLRARTAQQIHIESLSLDVTFRAGEAIFTEISRKFRRDTVAAFLETAGFVEDAWLDDGTYGLVVAAPQA